MPQILDNCVSSLKDKGVNESSAYAICTASLQRAGELPSTSKQKLNILDSFYKMADVSPVFLDTLPDSICTMASDEIFLITQLQGINDIAIDGVLGLAEMGSKVVGVNSELMFMQGNDELWLASILLHEAQHAIHSFHENEATKIEQKFAGRHYILAEQVFDRKGMFDAISIAATAQGQRELMVNYEAKKFDFAYLVGIGFPPRIVRSILKTGELMKKSMKESYDLARKQLTKQLLFKSNEFSDLILKTISKHLNVILTQKITPDIILKTEGEDIINECHMSGLEYKEMYEKYVKLAEDRGLLTDRELNKKGFISEMRKADYDVRKLPTELKIDRELMLKDLITSMSNYGLKFGHSLTDAHLMSLVYGSSPILKDLLKAN